MALTKGGFANTKLPVQHDKEGRGGLDIQKHNTQILWEALLPGGPDGPLCPLIPVPGGPLSPFSPDKPS